ncbi:RraA family protein [Bacillus canaveralius]|uniref:RraA family protein n=1 Tax=Bacillus canaveralius TaxID=1403243 RepID=UPI000F77A268|nr:RraA family protein [Bacillus canaveralius]RSK55138.1 RraA family protein [Bacillus canaveralius]
MTNIQSTLVGNVGFGYREEIERLDYNLIQSLKEVETASIVDAQYSTGVMNNNIKPLSNGMKVLGSAVTVDLPVGENLMLYKALQLAKPGDVLVVNTNGNDRTAIWGELMTLSARSLGLAGLIIDGMIRDGEENRKLDFPIFCTGTTPVTARKNGQGFVNGEITCGGIVVFPGDIIAGDDDGVVVIKKEHINLVIENLKAIEEREVRRKREIAEGKAFPDWLNRVLMEKGL